MRQPVSAHVANGVLKGDGSIYILILEVERMKALRIQRNKYPEVVNIDGSLESLQKEVGGPIQAIYPWDDLVALYL